MAVNQIAFNILKQLAPCRMLSLGVPDLLLTETFDLPLAKEQDFLKTLHAWSGPIYDTDSVFKHIGIEATYFDNKSWTGKEIVGDLNMSWFGMTPPKFWRESGFDLVLDPGTLEHCFNIGQAFVNVRNLCKPKGIIFHINPLNQSNHGFWCFSPTAYMDWYQEHGDKILNLTALQGDQELTVKGRTTFVAHDPAWLMCIVQRGEEPTLVRGWPNQFKYMDDEQREARKARSTLDLR